eukprot:gene1395-1540_t
MAEATTAEVIIKSIFMIIFIVLAICGNLLVCVAIKTNSRLQNLTNYYVFNLAVADFLFAITGMPLILITTIARKWILGHAMCQISGTLTTLFVLVSIFTLALISVNRYFAIGRATSYKSIYRKNRVLVSIACVWVFAAGVSIAPQLGWSRIKHGDNFCTIDGRKHLSYAGVVIALAYILPLFILICLYTKIFFVLRDHEKSMAEMRWAGNMNKQKLYAEADFETGSIGYSDSMRVTNNGEKTSTLQKHHNRDDENASHTNDQGEEKFRSSLEQETTQECGSTTKKTRDSDTPGGTTDFQNNIQTRPSSSSDKHSEGNDDFAMTKHDDKGRNIGSSPLVSLPEIEAQVELIVSDRTSPTVTYNCKDNGDGKTTEHSKRGRSVTGLTLNWRRKSKSPSKKIKKMIMEARVTRMLFVVVAFFFVCWTPLVVGTILYAFNAEPKNFNVLSMGFVIACMNSICNPIIYAFMNKLSEEHSRKYSRKCQQLQACEEGRG